MRIDGSVMMVTGAAIGWPELTGNVVRPTPLPE